MEFTNNQQQGTKRHGSASGFAHAMDMTTLLPALMHVRHAFQAAETGAAEGDDPVTESMLVQARLLQNEFKRLLGTDLTINAPDNPFWHTGTAVPLWEGDFRTRRPWEWVWRVAEGRSVGKGRARHERWDMHVRRFVFDHFFPF